MPSLALPFTLPARVVAQALDDLHAIAEAARSLPKIEARLTQQFEVLNGQAAELIAQAERMDARGAEVLAQSERIIAAAQQVADRGAEVVASLPHLQQLATTAEPLQGTIERFGRFVDRLPGAVRRPGEEP